MSKRIETAASSYAGDVTAQEAWAALEADRSAILIDVRTEPEWHYVGVPCLDDLGRAPALISWLIYPKMVPNPGFVAAVQALGCSISSAIYLVCRSGARSQAAAIALTEAGFGRCFNVSDGFEGDRDALGQRGRLGGWRASGLPWRQS